MSDFALRKILEHAPKDLNHVNMAFPADLLFTKAMVKGTVGGATGFTEYMGYALPGSAKASPVWLIKKLTYDAAGFVTDEQFADGTNKWDKIWNNYATYSYS